jgi:GNAT superfamily N-acetyltransferase
MSVTIVRPAQEHREAWDRLYAGYAKFYEVEQTQKMRDKVWGWIHDPAHQTECFLALDAAGKPIGLAHFRPFARPLAASFGGYLDDLFVDPEARGSKAADALIQAVCAEGLKRNWSVVRWITAENNYRARAVYDRMAVRTKWVTYDIALG